MRAVRIHEHGSEDELQVETVDRPDPGGHEVLLKVAAAGVNPVDTYFREGSYPPVGLPFTPGVDFAGTVAEVGEYVDGFDRGERVFGTGVGNADFQGAYAEFVSVPEDRLVHLPDSVNLTEAGAAGVAAVTAWVALVDHAELRPAELCLVHGGSGGVGHAAVQIAAAVSARVVATAAPEYHDALSGLGADTILDYDRTDLADAVRSASGGGVDVVLDHRLDDYLQFDAEVVSERGRVVGIGNKRAESTLTDLRGARAKDLNVQFMSMFNTPDLRVPLRGVAHLMDIGALSVEIADTFVLSAADEAHRAVMENSYLGKLVVEP
jgi:NADPH:quinone reductase-like Zn-dependent oxidoreductase